MSMHIYTVHINPALPQAYEAAVFVDEGFNWKAFLFTGLWTLYHRLWAATLGIILYNMILGHLLISNSLSHVGVGIVQLVIQILIGFHANDWLRAKLKKRGYLMADIVSGDSMLRAEQRFFDHYLAAHSNSIPA